MIIRPVHHGDLPALLHLAQNTGLGFTSLVPDEHHLRTLIDTSMRTLAAPLHESKTKNKACNQALFLVLCHPHQHKVIGVCGLGLRTPPAAPTHFHLHPWPGRAKHLAVSEGLLHPTHYETTHTHWMGLMLDPAYRMPHAGVFLSRCRGFYLAVDGDAWPQTVSAALRGISDETGHAPFWAAVGAPRSGLSFAAANHIISLDQDHDLRARLLAQPVAIETLTSETQSIIGRTHPQSLAALRLLQSDGFRYNGHLDMTDAGPHVIGSIPALRSVAQTRVMQLRVVAHLDPSSRPWMIRDTHQLTPRFALVPAVVDPDQAQDLWISAASARRHHQHSGDAVYACPLYLDAPMQASDPAAKL